MFHTWHSPGSLFVIAAGLWIAAHNWAAERGVEMVPGTALGGDPDPVEAPKTYARYRFARGVARLAGVGAIAAGINLYLNH